MRATTPHNLQPDKNALECLSPLGVEVAPDLIGPCKIWVILKLFLGESPWQNPNTCAERFAPDIGDLRRKGRETWDEGITVHPQLHTHVRMRSQQACPATASIAGNRPSRIRTGAAP